MVQLLVVINNHADPQEYCRLLFSTTARASKPRRLLRKSCRREVARETLRRTNAFDLILPQKAFETPHNKRVTQASNFSNERSCVRAINQNGHSVNS